MSYNLPCTNASPRDAPAPALATNQPEFSAPGAILRRGDNTLGNKAAESAANNPNPAVIISVADLQAIQQRIADLEKAVQQNSLRRRRSKSESDYERALKHSNLKGKTFDKY